MATSRTTTPTNAAAAAEPIPSDGTTTPVQAVTPTTTHYQQLANEFIAELDQIAAIIPKLEAQHVSTVNFVRSHLNASTEFLATVITAVEQTPELQGVGKLDAAAARDTLQFLEAFRPVLDKVTAFARNLQYAMNSRKASLVGDSLRIYGVAKAIAKDRRDPNRAAMGSHVANMKRILGRGRPTKEALLKKAAAAAAPKDGAVG
jgi:phosphoenolpyruvate carboxylase